MHARIDVLMRPRFWSLLPSIILDWVVVYRKGDIVKQPTKKDSFVPKNVPGVG